MNLRQKFLFQIAAAFAVFFVFTLASAAAEPSGHMGNADSWLQHWRSQNHFWRGVHLWLDNDKSAHELVDALPKLAADGVNVVVVEVDYSFEFQSHPELRNSHFVTRATAGQLTEAAHRCGIRLIPEFNCLGHQSFGGQISPLLRVRGNAHQRRHLQFELVSARAGFGQNRLFAD
jgi:hypothetical protein